VSRRDPWWLALVRWPLWSWGRLVTTVVVALVLGWGVGVGQGWLARGSAPAAASTPAVGTSSAATTAPTDPWANASAESSTTTTTTRPTASIATSIATTGAPAGAVAVAREFVTAWARPDMAAEPWWQALNPLCTSTFAALLHQTDPARVPAHRLVGEPVLSPSSSASSNSASSSSASSNSASSNSASSNSASPGTGATRPVGTQVVLLAPTDAGGVLVSVVLEGAGWLVSDVEPADAPPAASTAVPEASVAGPSTARTG
jgi:hypothetical protein